MNFSMLSKDEQNLVNKILFTQISKECVSSIIQVLVCKKQILSAEFARESQKNRAKEFLCNFWDFENSPYIKEKIIAGHSIHKRHAETSLCRIKKYWLPDLGNENLCEITKDDIRNLMYRLISEKKLTNKTINQIVRSILCPLRWAFNNNLIPENIAQGFVYCHVDSRKREVLSLKDAKKLFNLKWSDNFSRTANLVAACTGLRMGEIQALQIRDITKDAIIVRHSWSRNEGLKLQKNNCQREVPISRPMFKLLMQQIVKNPYGNCNSNFIFRGKNKNIPAGCRKWTEDLHERLDELNIKGNIVFHSWRHFYASAMANCVDQRKLQLATGHKSLQMLERYSMHQNSESLKEIEKFSTRIFSCLF